MRTDIIKRFLDWIGLKEKIHKAENVPPLFKEGEIRWCYIGENVGVEMNGKGGQFTRPIFILKKYDKYSFLGLPLTTKEKNGSWYVSVHFRDKKQTIVVSQGRVFDYRRFKEKIGQLENDHVENVREKYATLHTISPKNRPPDLSVGSRG